MTDIAYGGAAGTQIATLGYATGYTSVIDAMPSRRIKVNGWLTQVKIYGSLTSATVRVWRDQNPANLDCRTLVGSSTVPSNTLPNDTWVTLDTPIRVRSGDAVGLSYQTAGGLSLADGTGQKMWYENTNKTDSAAWANVATDRNVRIEFKGEAANLILFGDSITGGADGDATGGLRGWRPVRDTAWYTGAWIDPTFDYPYMLQQRGLGRVTCATGFGGQEASYGAANWAAAVAAYKVAGATVIMNWGINDIVAGTEYATHEGHWDTMLAAAASDGVRLVRQDILYVGALYPSGGGAATVNAAVDTWNASMRAWCLANGVKNIPLNSAWQAAWIGSDDAIHPSMTGYLAMAAMTKRRLGNNAFRRLVLMA